VRRVRIGKRTVKDGEAVAIWDQYGRHRQVVGPALCRLYYSTIRFLERHVAENGQYLRIRHQDGTIEHLRGPVVKFENPVYHLGITVEQAIRLDTPQSYIVVTKEAGPKDASAAPSREVKHGPLLFYPSAQETVQSFAAWSIKGSGVLSENERVINVGSTQPMPIACQVQGADNHTATVKVEVRFRIVGIDEVLKVKDPVGECQSATQAAVLKALAAIKFSQLGSTMLEQVRSKVAAVQAELTADLLQRGACELVSLTVTSVEPSSALAKILTKEDDLAASKVQNQIADASLAAAVARQKQEEALAIAKQTHELKLAAEKHQQDLKQRELESHREIEHLRELRGLGVDLTQYLCRSEARKAKSSGFCL